MINVDPTLVDLYLQTQKDIKYLTIKSGWRLARIFMEYRVNRDVTIVTGLTFYDVYLFRC